VRPGRMQPACWDGYAPGSAPRETGRSPSSTSSSVARHPAFGRVTGSGIARLSCAGSCNLILRPLSFAQNEPSFCDPEVSLYLRRKGLQNPSFAAGRAPIAPWGRPRWGTACPRPCEETPRPEAQHLARLVLASINVVRQEQCARGRGIKQGTRVGLPRHGINAPFLLELGRSDPCGLQGGWA